METERLHEKVLSLQEPDLSRNNVGLHSGTFSLLHRLYLDIPRESLYDGDLILRRTVT